MTPEERDQLCQLAGVRPTVDNATLGAALIEAIHEAIDEYGEAEVHARARRGAEAHQRRQASAEQTAPPAAPAAPTGPMPASDAEAVAWAVQTGRIGLARADFWARELAAERNASGSIARGWATLQSLAPVYADGGMLDSFGGDMIPVGPVSATPMLDAMERSIYGPTSEQIDAELDRQAEAEARAIVDREQAGRVRDVRRSQLIREHRAHTARIAAELEDLDPEAEELARQLYPPEAKPKPTDRRPRQETYSITPQGIVRNED